MSKRDIVIPFIEKGQNWEELRYTLRSIATYCGDWLNSIWLIGDKPEWANVKHVPTSRRADIKYNCWHDTRDKTIAVLEHSDISSDYVLWYDDIVCLNNIELEDIEIQKAVCDLSKVDIHNRFGDAGRRYRNILSFTRERLQADGLPTWNYETHLPRLFNKSGMKHTLIHFDLTDEIIEQPCMLPTCYYNVEYPGAQPEDISGFDSRWKMIARPREDYKTIAKRAKTAKWLNYNNTSLSKGLKKYISERFSQPCIFEKEEKHDEY